MDRKVSYVIQTGIDLAFSHATTAVIICSVKQILLELTKLFRTTHLKYSKLS